MSRIVILLLSASLPMSAAAVTFKCVDREGRVSYSQTAEPGKRCVEATLPPVQVVPGSPVPPRSPTPTSTESSKAADKPKTPEQEIAEARKALDEARRKLAEQEAVRYGDERNYQRVLDRLKPFQDAVAQAEARLKELQDRAATTTSTQSPASGGKY